MLLFCWDMRQFETLPFGLSGSSVVQLHLIPRSSDIDLFTSFLFNSYSESIKAGRLYRSRNIPWQESYLIIAPESMCSSILYLISVSSQKVWTSWNTWVLPAGQVSGKQNAGAKHSAGRVGLSGMLMHPVTEDAHR